MASVLTPGSIHTCTHTHNLEREKERFNSIYFRGILVCLPGTANLTGLTVHSSFFLSHTNSCLCPPILISGNSVLQVLQEGRLRSSQKPFFHLLPISKQTADPAALTLKTPRIQPLLFTSVTTTPIRDAIICHLHYYISLRTGSPAWLGSSIIYSQQRQE